MNKSEEPMPTKMTTAKITSTAKTSTTDPIYVSWILDSRDGIDGKVGLTFAPGKHATSKYGHGRWERDLGADLDRLVHVEAMAMQVCLLEDHELAALRIPALVEEATKRGVRVVRLPIPDGGVLPGERESVAMRALITDILQTARAGKNVVIHCMGGLGRAGTIGGCVLAEHGFTADAALARLRERRGKNCPETEAQRSFIRFYRPHAH